MKNSPLFRYVFITLIAFVVYVLFIKHDNALRWAHAGITIRQQEKQIEACRQDISDLDARIEAMTSDKDSIERFARETYLFAEPGDDVYLVSE